MLQIVMQIVMKFAINVQQFKLNYRLFLEIANYNSLIIIIVTLSFCNDVYYKQIKIARSNLPINS